jgi:WD40 repeat protein
VYSPDSSRIALPDPAAHEIYILNASDGETITRLKSPVSDDPCLAWSADGKLIAISDVDSVIVIGARDGGGVRRIVGGCPIAFSTDSRLVATSMDTGFINLWDIESGERVSLEGHSDQIIAMSFSPDGTMLASSSVDGTLVIWDVSQY